MNWPLKTSSYTYVVSCIILNKDS